MFDIGGPELILIAIIAIIVIGPKELPAAIRTVTGILRRARGLAAEFRSGLDEMVRESELNEIKKDIEAGLDPDGLENSIAGDLKSTIDPEGEFDRAFELDGDWYGPDEEQAYGAQQDPDAETPAVDSASAQEAGDTAQPGPDAAAGSEKAARTADEETPSRRGTSVAT